MLRTEVVARGARADQPERLPGPAMVGEREKGRGVSRSRKNGSMEPEEESELCARDSGRTITRCRSRSTALSSFTGWDPTSTSARQPSLTTPHKVAGQYGWKTKAWGMDQDWAMMFVHYCQAFPAAGSYHDRRRSVCPVVCFVSMWKMCTLPSGCRRPAFGMRFFWSPCWGSMSKVYTSAHPATVAHVDGSDGYMLGRFLLEEIFLMRAIPVHLAIFQMVLMMEDMQDGPE